MFYYEVQKRLYIAFVIIMLFFLAIVIRMFYIQVFKSGELSELANSLWSRNLPILADRGLILDRNGVVLADNITTTSVVVIPNQINDKEKVSSELAKILNTDYENVFKFVNKKSSIERIHPYGRGLSYEIAEKINNLNFDGVYLVKESKRYYPYETMLSHVLGYVGIDNQGLSGIELFYDDHLRGNDGAIKYYSDGKGHRLKLSEVYNKPVGGNNIGLTIDVKIQEMVERELDNVMLSLNPEQALVLVMDPNTSEIIAMSSRPNFDSNNYQNYDIETINRNLPIWATFEPGSTFKIITVAASLEEKTVNLFEDHFHDSGSITVESARIKCWKAGGHGSQTFLEVVQNSCNPGFVVLGQRLGTKRLHDYLLKFGFGSKTGIDLNGESTGILFSLDRMGPIETATSAFGQGISVTALQQVNGVSAAINGGKLHTPYIVRSISEPETNEVVLLNKPKFVRNVISEETSEMVKYTLETVVAHGTGRNAYIENYRVAGKTGTAQKVNNGVYMVGNYILSFMGIFPADNPDYVVYVAIDNPKGITQYGGTVAAPVAKNIILSIIDYLDYKPVNNELTRAYTWLDEKYVYLDNVIGLDVKEVKQILKNFRVEYSGTGNTIIDQSPHGGYLVKEGSVVKLMLN
ncbi:MAG TPA: stage V sporulation protein D [Mollicutes bacterium]|nr:stage V sporulation protein D [Mollicutes bacterium]